MTAREREILDLLRDQPLMAQQALAEQGFILAIGAVNMDISGDTPNAIVAHDSTPGRIRCAPGGVARNVAENLARLGDAVRLVSAVGSDLFGLRLLEVTRSAGVDVRDCLVLDDQATSTYLSIHGPDGDMALALNDMAILAQITPARLHACAARLRQARAVLVDCNLSDDALGWVFGQAQAQAVFAEPVSAFKCRRLLPWLDQVHTLKANRLEAQALTGLPVDDDPGLVQATQWLHDKGVSRVVLSLGARGAYWSERAGASGWQAALPAEVVNATGAGDAMMAGLLHGYLQGEPLSSSIGFASACAAMTLGAPQANHVSMSVVAVQQLQQAHAGCDPSPSSPDPIPTCS